MRKLISCKNLQHKWANFVNSIYKYHANGICAGAVGIGFRVELTLGAGAGSGLGLSCVGPKTNQPSYPARRGGRWGKTAGESRLVAGLDVDDVDAGAALGFALGAAVHGVLGGNEEGQDKETARRQDGDEQGVVAAVQLHLKPGRPAT